MLSKIVLVILMLSVMCVAVFGKTVRYGEEDMEFTKPDDLCLEVLDSVEE